MASAFQQKALAAIQMRNSKGAAKAQLSRIIGGLGGGGLIGRNFVSPAIQSLHRHDHDNSRTTSCAGARPSPRVVLLSHLSTVITNLSNFSDTSIPINLTLRECRIWCKNYIECVRIA